MRAACYVRVGDSRTTTAWNNNILGMLSARAQSRPQIWSMLGNCQGKYSSELYARLERAFQTSGNNEKHIIEPIGNHIALSMK